jgi:hypothetical protein
MNKVVEILRSYKNYFTATSHQKIIAARRLAICQSCEKWNGIICTQCGCFTEVKVFSPNKESCPLLKWNE